MSTLSYHVYVESKNKTNEYNEQEQDHREQIEWLSRGKSRERDNMRVGIKRTNYHVQNESYKDILLTPQDI